jgi:hypothetical protein
MISEDCRIDEFVEMVKGKTPWEVIVLANEEATWADRMFLQSHGKSDCRADDCGQQYSRSLKRLINYMRYTIKPKRSDDQVYDLYTTHWGSV